MRLFISGSAPLLEQTFEAFQQRTGHAILERYGMTETGMNTSNPLEGPRLAGTVGKPLPGVAVRIVDEGFRDVGTDQVGSLLVKGDNVFKGYWRLPEKTAEVFTEDGYFITGDLATWSEDGYITLVGRSKDLIITGGYNVYPKEVERCIDSIEGVVESAVIGVPHVDYGEAVIAIVVPDPGRETLTEAFIIKRLKTQLAGYKVPKRIVFQDLLPRNAMGKVQKHWLRDSVLNAP
jgi:malonyl-CoA/methylmalonyl-CoA synthetase